MEIKMRNITGCHEKVMTNVTKSYEDNNKIKFKVVDKLVDCTKCKHGKEMSSSCGFFRNPMSIMEEKDEFTPIQWGNHKSRRKPL